MISTGKELGKSAKRMFFHWTIFASLPVSFNDALAQDLSGSWDIGDTWVHFTDREPYPVAIHETVTAMEVE